MEGLESTQGQESGQGGRDPGRRSWRWLGRYALAAAVLVLLPMLALAGPSAEGPGQEKVDAQLVDQLAVTGRANFWVRLEAQADLSGAEGMDWEERGWRVYRALLDTAAVSQRDVLADLKSRGLQAETFWINNSIHVRGGSLRDVQALAARPDVARIMAEEVVYLPEPPSQVEGVLATAGWGVDWIHAPEVWAQGVDGSGIVVANIDTGVQFTHPQLNNTYRGALDGHAYNWCDPSDICAGDAPCDNHGHGTHVMGALSGENDDPVADPNTIGVAPGSTWIACKGCEGGTCSDYALLQCAEWVLAPTDRLSGNCGEAGLGDPTKRPHVVNNSWGDSGGDDWYLDAVQAWRAAGIFPAFSAGNQNACGSIGSPGDYRDSFASGNLSSTGSINASYSSRGPGVRTVGGVPDYYCKPNVAAPGTDIYSSIPTYPYYSTMTGTSMASPHSAGAVALLWDACPELIGQIDVTFQVLELSATTPPADPCAATAGCADAGCNCTYGAGALDALAAVQTCTTGAQWTPVAMPNPRPIDWTRFDGAFDPHDNKIYFLGGQTSSQTIRMSQDPSIWTYDPGEGRWADTGCDLNHGVTNYTAAYVEDDGTGRGESLYVIGGYVVEQAEYTNVVQRYYPSEPGCLVEDVTTDPFPGVLSGPVVGAGGVTVVDGAIYYVGGWQARQEPYFTDQTWVYDPLAAPGRRWTEVAALSAPRSFLSAAALGSKIYALGGFSEYVPLPESTVPTDTVEVLDLTQPELGWQPLARLPMATAEGQAFVPLTDTLYVAGGSQWPTPAPDVSAYDATHDLWDAAFPDLTFARRNHAGAYVSACTPDPYDGLPAMWVFGGQVTSVSTEPLLYGEPEYWPLACPDPVTPTAQLAVDVAGETVASGEPVTGTAPLTVRFVDRSVGVLDRRWDFGDGSPPSDNWRPLYTYLAGHYTVTLTVSNAAGSDQANVAVIVERLPHRISYLPLIMRRE